MTQEEKAKHYDKAIEMAENITNCTLSIEQRCVGIPWRSTI